MTCELLIYVCVNTDSNVLHQFLCLSCINTYLQRLSCIHILCSLRKRGGLKKDFEFRISILCFRQRPQQVSLRQLHCDVECFDWRMKISNDVYFQYNQLMFRGLKERN